MRSSVAFKRPAVAPLLDGQAAININPSEPGLFFKDSNGADLIKIGPVAVNITGQAPNSSPAGSIGNSIGETWLDGRGTFASPTMKVWDGLEWQPSNGFEVNDATGEFSFDQLMSVRTLESFGTGANSYLRIPQDDAAARSAIVANRGMIRFNTTTLVFEGYDGTSWNSFAFAGGDIVFIDLTATGDTVLGNNCLEDTLTINSVTSINCDTTIGANNTNTLSVVSVISSDLIPDGVSRTLGASTARWNAFTNNHSANILSVESSVSTDLIPTVDGTQDLGGTSQRWATLFAQDVSVSGDILPVADTVSNLGSATQRFANLYTGDLHLANDRGDWTMIEEKDYLSLRNNKTGKTFMLVMEAVD